MNFRLTRLTFLFAVLVALMSTSVSRAQRPDMLWMRGGHPYPSFVDFLAGDQTVVTGGLDGTLKVRRISDGVLLKTIPAGGQIYNYQGKISPNGKYLAVFINRAPLMYLWNVPSSPTGDWTLRWSAVTFYGDHQPKFSADSSMVASSGQVFNVADGSIAWSWKISSNDYDLRADGAEVASAGGFFSAGSFLDAGGWPTGFPTYSQANPSKVATYDIYWDAIDSPVTGIRIFDKTIGPNFGQTLQLWYLGNFGGIWGPAYRCDDILWPNTTAFGDQYIFTNGIHDGADHFELDCLDTVNSVFIPLGITSTKAVRETAVGVSHDGRTAALGWAADKPLGEEQLKLFSVPDGHEVQSFQDHSDAVLGVAYSALPLTFLSADGVTTVSAHVVVSSSNDRTVRLWHAQTGELLHTIELPDYVPYELTISPDGKTLVICHREPAPGRHGGVLFFDITDPRNPLALPSPFGNGYDFYFYSPTYSPDGKYFAVCFYVNNTDIVILCKVTPTGLVGVQEFTLGTFDYQGGYMACAFSPDSKTLAAEAMGGNGWFYLLSVPNLTQIRRTGTWPATGIAYSPDGKRIAVSSTSVSTGRVWLYDATTLSQIGPEQVLPGGSWAVAYEPCNEFFISGADGGLFSPGIINLRKGTDGTLLKTYDQEAGVGHGGYGCASAFAFSPDGQYIAYGRADDTVAVMKNPYWALPKLTAVSVSPAAIGGGSTATGTVTFGCPAPIGNAVITLSSSNPALVSVPASATMTVGKKTATFPVTTSSPATPQSVTISATYNNITKTKVITVNPPVLSSFILEQTSVTGPLSDWGVVTMTGPVAVDTTVLITSGNSAAHVPASIVVPAGQSTAVVQPIQIDVVGSITSGPIIATQGGVTKSVTLTVLPAALYNLVLTPNPVVGGNDVTGQVQMTGPVFADTTVNLTNANTKATLPSSTVTIPAGADRVQFTMATVKTTKAASGAVKAQVGIVSKSVTLKVTP